MTEQDKAMALRQPDAENAISVAMSEGNKHGVPSTVSARIVAAYLNATAPVSQPAAQETLSASAGSEQEDGAAGNSQGLDVWKKAAEELEEVARDCWNAGRMNAQARTLERIAAQLEQIK